MDDGIRDSLKNLLDDNGDDNGPNIPSYNQNVALDYDDLKVKSQKKAKKLMDQLLKFYLSQDLIEEGEYITAKTKLDTMTLTSIIYQMKTSEHAITTLMRTIDSGELSPRMFEVLGGLQKTLLDIMKHQTLHMMASEENLKKLKRDRDIYKIDGGPKQNKLEGPNTDRMTMGTRNIMQQIQDDIREEKSEADIDFEDAANEDIDDE